MTVSCAVAATPTRRRAILIAACAALSAGAVGCGPVGRQPPTTAPLVASTVPPAPVAPAEQPATPVAAGVAESCEHATINAQQFIGDWTEPGEAAVTKLSGDYTLKSGSGNESGSWSYLPWASSPGNRSMPAGEDNHCVLWLHWQTPTPPLDLVYVPLKATSGSLELSYVGRGNTVTWVRPQPSP